MGKNSKPYQYFNNRSPLLLELPHGGYITPQEVMGHERPTLTPGQIRDDSDEFSDAFYLDLPCNPDVLRFVYWRAFLDPNRKMDDFGIDGVVKTHTSQGIQIYQSSKGIRPSIRDKMIQRCVVPYREKLLQLVSDPQCKRIVCAHTMPGIGTSISDDAGQLRPLFMLSNGGGSDGKPGKSYYAPKKFITHLAEIVDGLILKLGFDTGFQYLDTVRINHPYSGMNSLHRFTKEQVSGKFPFTLEINRDAAIYNQDNIPILKQIINEILQEALRWGD